MRPRLRLCLRRWFGLGRGAGPAGLAPRGGFGVSDARVAHEWAESVVQTLRVLGAEVDLVLLAVQGKRNGVLGVAAIEIVYEDNRALLGHGGRKLLVVATGGKRALIHKVCPDIARLQRDCWAQ